MHDSASDSGVTLVWTGVGVDGQTSVWRFVDQRTFGTDLIAQSSDQIGGTASIFAVATAGYLTARSAARIRLGVLQIVMRRVFVMTRRVFIMMSVVPIMTNALLIMMKIVPIMTKVVPIMTKVVPIMMKTVLAMIFSDANTIKPAILA
jgi:hypothetical protein